MRSVKGELTSLVLVLLAPVIVASVFPYGMFNFVATDRDIAEDAFTVAVVHLSEEDEMAAIKAAKVAWKNDISDFRRMHADLSIGELPESDTGEMLKVESRNVADRQEVVGCGTPPYLPSRKAGGPVKIEPVSGPANGNRAFPREELLKLE